MSRREADIFACLVDTLLAPEPPLPPVGQTDAVPALERWLAAGPRLNRVLLRAALLGFGAARLRRRSRADRLALVRHAPDELIDALRAIAGLSYYGDPNVTRLVRR